MLLENVQNTGISIYAVFDGHGTDFSSKWVKRHLTTNLLKKIVDASNIVRGKSTTPVVSETTTKDKKRPKTYGAEHYVDENNNIDFSSMLTDEILACDYDLLKKLRRIVEDETDENETDENETEKKDSGTTVLIVISDGKWLTVANVGDSRGVLGTSNGLSVPLSTDQKAITVCRMVFSEIYRFA